MHSALSTSLCCRCAWQHPCRRRSTVGDAACCAAAGPTSCGCRLRGCRAFLLVVEWRPCHEFAPLSGDEGFLWDSSLCVRSVVFAVARVFVRTLHGEPVSFTVAFFSRTRRLLGLRVALVPALALVPSCSLSRLLRSSWGLVAAGGTSLIPGLHRPIRPIRFRGTQA